MSIGTVVNVRGAGQYEAVHEELADAPPAGCISHAAGTNEDGLWIIDVRQSQSDFDRFVRTEYRTMAERVGLNNFAQRITAIDIVNTEGHGARTSACDAGA
jgi:hypothetical protein